MGGLLYKYLPPARTDVLEYKRIRFTQPILFNDPFEPKPHLTYGLTPDEIKRVLLKILAKDRISEKESKNFELNLSSEYLEGNRGSDLKN